MNDIERVRDLAKKTREFALSPEMERRRKLWTDHNSLYFTRPPIYIRAVPFHEYITSADLRCQDPGLRNLEWRFLLNQYYSSVVSTNAIASSSNCFGATLVGASVIRHDASFPLGNAITSRILSS